MARHSDLNEMRGALLRNSITAHVNVEDYLQMQAEVDTGEEAGFDQFLMVDNKKFMEGSVIAAHSSLKRVMNGAYPLSAPLKIFNIALPVVIGIQPI